MAIKVKQSGVYADVVGVFAKDGGTYSAVQGIYAKSGGAYGSVSFSLTPVLRVASLSGVAPFGLTVDGVQTTTSDPAVRPLRDLTYFFVCSDPGMGNYVNGELAGKPRNRFVGGPVAAFTLVTPGTQTIDMYVYDGTTLYGPSTVSVTVQDPDVVFAGSATTVVSTSGDFTGKPAGAIEVTSSDFDAQITSGVVSGSNKRVLFKVGETFQSSAVGSFNSRTNYFVGTYGTGADYAIVQATANGINGMFGGSTFSAAQNNDKITCTGLHFTRALGGGVTGGIGVVTGGRPETVGGTDYIKGNYTFHKCKVSNIVAFGSAIGGYNTVFSQCVAENINEGVAVGGGIGIFMDETVRGAVIDSDIDCNNGGEHGIRRQGGDFCTFISNRIRRPAANKSFLTIRGWQNRTDVTQVVSRYNQVSYNNIDGSTNGTVKSFLSIDIAPQNGTAYEPIAECVVEGNFVYSHDIGFSTGVRLQVSSTVYRNNAHYYTTQITSDFFCVQIAGPSTNTTGAHDCDFVGNSFNSVSLANGFSVFSKQAGSGADNRVYNNIAYAPNATRNSTGTGSTPTLYLDSSGTIIAANNSSNAQVKSTNPLFNAATTTLAGFKLQTGSPYKNFGDDYKNHIDALEYLRGSTTPDGGALNSVDKQVSAWTLVP